MPAKADAAQGSRTAPARKKRRRPRRPSMRPRPGWPACRRAIARRRRSRRGKEAAGACEAELQNAMQELNRERTLLDKGASTVAGLRRCQRPSTTACRRRSARPRPRRKMMEAGYRPEEIAEAEGRPGPLQAQLRLAAGRHAAGRDRRSRGQSRRAARRRSTRSTSSATSGPSMRRSRRSSKC